MKFSLHIKTALQRLSFSVIILFLITVALFIFHQYVIGLIAVLIIIILLLFWYRFLGEEICIYQLKQNSGKLKYEYLIDVLSRKKADKVIRRLQDKRIIEMNEDIISLLNLNQLSTFEERRKSEFKP